MVDTIGTQLGLHGPETFMETFLPQIDINCHTLFDKAIDELSGENAEYWRDIRDAPTGYWQDIKDTYEPLLSICTEQVVECFSAEFVNSSYETIYEQDFTGDRANIPTWQEMVGILKDDIASKDAS